MVAVRAVYIFSTREGEFDIYSFIYSSCILPDRWLQGLRHFYFIGLLRGLSRRFEPVLDLTAGVIYSRLDSLILRGGSDHVLSFVVFIYQEGDVLLH